MVTDETQNQEPLPAIWHIASRHTTQHSTLNTQHSKLNTQPNNQQPRTKNQEPRTKNQEPRTKNQEPRTKNQTPLPFHFSVIRLDKVGNHISDKFTDKFTVLCIT